MLWLAALAWANPPAAPTPDAPGDVMPDRHWDETRLALDVRIDPAAGTVSGTATHVVSPLGRRHGTLRLHAVALDISKVTVDGAPVEPRIGREHLDIPMPSTGERHEVTVTYTARPETGMHFRVAGPGSPYSFTHVWTQGESTDNRHWFPGWDYPNDQFTYEASITVPTGMSAVSNGILLGTGDNDDGTTRWNYALGLPITTYHVAIAAGDYRVVRDEGTPPQEYWVPPSWTPEQARATWGIAADQATWFGEWLGLAYPWPVYRQVAAEEFLYTGMENPTVTVLEAALVTDPRTERGAWVEEVLAHEMGHHWFGDWLVCYGWRELWLNEGFATYAALRWQEHTRGAEFAATVLWDDRRHALRDPAPMAARAWSRVGDRENAAVYGRGEVFLHGLERYLGREAFDAGLRRYVAEHGGRLVETEDFRRALEDASGTHLGWLFDAFVHGASFPELTSAWSWDAGELEVRLVASTTSPRLPVDVEIGTRTGSIRKRLWTGDGETRLVMPLDEAPSWVAVDPEGALLATWTHEQPAAAWAAQVAHSEVPLARLAAAHSLAASDDAALAVATLRPLAATATLDPTFRAELVEALAEVVGPDARAALVELSSDPSAVVRDATIGPLSEGVGSPDVVARLKAMATTDADPGVRAAALEGLAAHDAKQGLALARKRLTQPDTTPYAGHRAAISLIGDHGDGKDLSLLLAWTSPERPSSVRRMAALNAMVRFDALSDDDRDDRRVEVTTAVAGLLDSPDQVARSSALSWLGRIGGAEAEAALEAFAARTTLPGHRTAALDAAAAARGHDDAPPPEPAEAPDEERLDAAIDDLEDRVKRLETWR